MVGSPVFRVFVVGPADGETGLGETFRKSGWFQATGWTNEDVRNRRRVWVGTDRGNRASSDQMLDTNEREWVIEGVAIHCKRDRKFDGEPFIPAFFRGLRADSTVSSGSAVAQRLIQGGP